MVALGRYVRRFLAAVPTRRATVIAHLLGYQREMGVVRVVCVIPLLEKKVVGSRELGCIEPPERCRQPAPSVESKGPSNAPTVGHVSVNNCFCERFSKNIRQNFAVGRTVGARDALEMPFMDATTTTASSTRWCAQHRVYLPIPAPSAALSLSSAHALTEPCMVG